MTTDVPVEELIARALRAALATDKVLRARSSGRGVDQAAAYNLQTIVSLNAAKRKQGDT